MSILITGGAGYVGSHVAHALDDAGERAVVIDDLSNGAALALPEHTPLVVGDCGDRKLLGSVFGQHKISAIMHLAGSVSVTESMHEPQRYRQNNFVNTQTLFNTALEHGIDQFVFSSTSAVYGQPSETPITESTETIPLSPYGESKLAAERSLYDAATARALKLVVFRFFNVAGADPAARTGQSRADATHLIRRTVQTAIGLRPELHVYGSDYDTPDGTCIRDYVHVADVARALIDALRYMRAGGAPVTLNCGGSRGVSVHEVIDAVKRIAGVDFRVVHAARRAGDPASIVASIDRARAILGWRPELSNLEDIIRHELAWETKRKALHGRSTALCGGT